MVGGKVMFVKGQIASETLIENTTLQTTWIPVCEIARPAIHVVVDRTLWEKVQKTMSWNSENIEGDYTFDERVKGGSINYADWEEIGIMMGWLPDIHKGHTTKITGEDF